ncbi:carbohydrate ABC transporter permease [Candidatus Entotheonella palauensis]|uniref:carbohydrate ABC transporter permease n=1 Tax=Candidatus Entotheonella palauensis TaxID=93172 RepID=UPI000B7CA04E|nr:sugar ABC transporter permease [Candidatus Entotheonella palauensis]
MAKADQSALFAGPDMHPVGRRKRRGLLNWFAQERVFRLIPFVLVEGLFLLLLALPFVLTVYISLLKWRANRPFEQAYFQGFVNYVRVLSEPEFWWALGRTFYLAGVAVSLELVLGFCLAMLVHQEFRGRKVYITIFLIPMMVVPVMVGYNFSMLYIDSGPINQLLAPFLTPFGINPRIRWLSHPVAAQWAIILADVWQWTSLTFLIFLSGFSALPRDLIHAARVMGASPWQIFWRIQLPLLKPAIIVAVVIRSMEALKLFDQAVLLTFGGPGEATQTIAFFLWRQVWQFNKYSFGAAASVLLLFLFAGLIYAGIYLLVRERALLQQGENS